MDGERGTKRFLRDLDTEDGERQLRFLVRLAPVELGVYDQQATVIYAPRGLMDYPSGA